jgi:hypothetical protein
VTGVDQLDGSLEQGVSRGPLRTFSRDHGLFAEDQRGQRRDVESNRDVVGMGEQRVSPLEVAIEQPRHRLGVQHGRPVGTGRTETLEREGGIRTHRCGTLVAQVGPHVGQGGGDRTAVGQDGGVRKALGDADPALGLARPAEQRQD